MFSVHAFAACIYFKVPVTLVYDCFIGIITATLLWSVTVAVIVYVMARKQKRGLSPGGNTGLTNSAICMWFRCMYCNLYMYKISVYTGHEILKSHGGISLFQNPGKPGDATCKFFFGMKPK